MSEYLQETPTTDPQITPQSQNVSPAIADAPEIYDGLVVPQSDTRPRCQASLQLNGDHICAVAFAGGQTFIGAGHCGHGTNGEDFPLDALEIVAGVYNLDDPSRRVLDVVASNFDSDNPYNQTTFENDLRSFIVDGSTAGLVTCNFDFSGNVTTGETAYIYGWGQTESGQGSRRLLTVNYQQMMLTNAEIQTISEQPIYEENFATGAVASQNSPACWGESGGSIFDSASAVVGLMSRFSNNPPSCNEQPVIGVLYSPFRGFIEGEVERYWPTSTPISTESPTALPISTPTATATVGPGTPSPIPHTPTATGESTATPVSTTLPTVTPDEDRFADARDDNFQVEAGVRTVIGVEGVHEEYDEREYDGVMGNDFWRDEFPDDARYPRPAVNFTNDAVVTIETDGTVIIDDTGRALPDCNSSDRLSGRYELVEQETNDSDSADIRVCAHVPPTSTPNATVSFPAENNVYLPIIESSMLPFAGLELLGAALLWLAKRKLMRRKK